MKKRLNTTNDCDALMVALLNWLNTQDASPADVVNVFTGVVGSVIGGLSDNKEDLAQVIAIVGQHLSDSACEVYRDNAKLRRARADNDE